MFRVLYPDTCTYWKEINIQDTTVRDLKYLIIYRRKKNTYGIPNTYRTVTIPVSTWQEYFSKPFVLKSYAALCTVNSTIQYSIPAFLSKTYRKKINIPKFLTERYRNTGLLPSLKKYWKVSTKIPTGEP